MKLKIECRFTDKYNGKNYHVGDEIEFEAERAKELLNDSRHLVSKVEVVDDPVDEPKKARRKKN